MVRRVISFILFVLLIVACSTGDDDSCDVIVHHGPIPKQTVKAYKLIVHSDTPSHKVGPILDAAAEWATATQGAFLYEASYGLFDTAAEPDHGEIRVYIGPDTDPESRVIGVCAWWGTDEPGRPYRSVIWIQDDLGDRAHYLVALHEIGHALGVAHSTSTSSIMFPTLTDTGDHVPCQDVVSVCKIWGCPAPACQ